jgi:hypothetical protein
MVTDEVIAAHGTSGDINGLKNMVEWKRQSLFVPLPNATGGKSMHCYLIVQWLKGKLARKIQFAG